ADDLVVLHEDAELLCGVVRAAPRAATGRAARDPQSLPYIRRRQRLEAAAAEFHREDLVDASIAALDVQPGDRESRSRPVLDRGDHAGVGQVPLRQQVLD